MASAFTHRLFTRGHVKYVRFHGDRAVDRGMPGGGGGYQDVGTVRGSEFHSRLSLAIRLDASSPVLPPLAKNEGAIFPSMRLGNRRIKEHDLDSADLH